jgi:molybdopterin molybdotransferase
MADNPPHDDVRMRGFARRSTVAFALAWIDERTQPLTAERVSLWEAAGRILAADVTSPCQVPAFRRSMMDGFAVQAAETLGASEYNRLSLAEVGHAFPGKPYGGTVAAGQAVRIMTGAPMPSGADAVVPAEQAECVGGQVWIDASCAVQKNVALPGEDVALGETVLTQGRRLRPQDVGLLSAIGVPTVEVVRRPRVRILISGNELLPAGQPPNPPQIADANGPMLAALIERDGGVCVWPEPPENYLLPDNPERLTAELTAPGADLILVSGGSSVGEEDLAPVLVARLGELPIHGVAMRPSSPAGMGSVGNSLVFLLPGNPISCLCAYDFFAGRAIRRLGGLSTAWPYASATKRLTRKLTSQIGRLDYARVRIAGEDAEPLAVGGASVLSSATRGDGFVVIDPDLEGYPAGALVTVHLYQPV